VATPTEGGAMGAMGALIMAGLRRRLDMKLLQQALASTTRLACFVMFILIGATMFSLVFQAADGPVWVEHLLASLPGGQIGFLVAVNVLIFILAFFLDYFELSFIVIPLLGPVAQKLGIDLIWFGVLLAVNMQTSFMHPPFGFALFFLRSVAPDKPYLDRVTQKIIQPITTMQIYRGAIPFVLIQLFMVGVLIFSPGLVTGNLDKQEQYDLDKVGEQMRDAMQQDDEGYGGGYGSEPESGNDANEPGGGEETPDGNDDAAKALEDALKPGAQE
jgi:TRAP-type mannitol/chloroaromatic compound transport system permease large subunit